MACPHLEYRQEAEDTSFDHERAFCTAVDAFVQPMRADVCNDRHGLDHVAHCEFYRDAEGLDPLAGLDPDASPDETTAGEGADGG